MLEITLQNWRKNETFWIVFKLGVSSSNVFTLCNFWQCYYLVFVYVLPTTGWKSLPWSTGTMVSIEIVVVKRSAAVAPPLLSWIFKGQNHQVFYGELLSFVSFQTWSSLTVASVLLIFAPEKMHFYSNSVQFLPLFQLCFPCFYFFCFASKHLASGPRSQFRNSNSSFKMFWSKLPLQHKGQKWTFLRLEN